MCHKIQECPLPFGHAGNHKTLCPHGVIGKGTCGECYTIKRRDHARRWRERYPGGWKKYTEKYRAAHPYVRRGRPIVTCEHGVVGKSKCVVCKRATETKFRRAHGVKPRAEYVGKTKGELRARRKALCVRLFTECRAFTLWLREAPCMDCGETKPPNEMHFHHRDRATKIAEVKWFVSRGYRQEMVEEILKCDLICASCHRQRHKSA